MPPPSVSMPKLSFSWLLDFACLLFLIQYLQGWNNFAKIHFFFVLQIFFFLVFQRSGSMSSSACCCVVLQLPGI